VSKRYELVNPSDAIEFTAASDEVAALAAIAVGAGKYSAFRLGDDETQPNGPNVIGFAFFGGDAGYQETYGRSIEDGLKALNDDLATALASFGIRGGRDRSSMNDICGTAHNFAKALRRGAS
jgi:hypothetical protein